MVLHADMQPSTRPNDCWSAHILSAKNGLTQLYISKQKLQNCEPIDLSRLVVGLRERHLEYWTPHSETHPRKHNSKRSTPGVLFLPKGPWSLICLTSFSDTCFSTCLVISFAVQFVSDFVFTPCVLRQRHGTIKGTPPPMVLMLSKMYEQCDVLFLSANPHVISLRRNVSPNRSPQRV